MTTKEAIEKLKEISFMTGYNEALDLAIKALEFIEENYPKTFEDYLNGEQI